ncbi:MAG: glycine zipper 2TM domain-containing protein [Sphingomonas sp.]|uniref:glycine zipper 2TM domain-containing protein n=1 Tax=Sphingomonas sp. TaxID=28214 RepID=UPI0025E940FA|nr:glycine zipper 2TM domain-containing protein [Sphingomonas sp.]MBY0282708.1 glycine zipper 2TM domain-containing protein [Sphingomonas sp.]
MKRMTSMLALAAATLAFATPAMAQTSPEEARYAQAQARFQQELRVFQQEFDRYQAWQSSRPRFDDRRYDDRRDPRYDPRVDDRDEGGYDPSRYYRNGPNYNERVLSADDRVYRGNDGRYYCKRNDGTTGLIIGAVGGGILGNVIDGGRSRAVGTLLGGGLGAILGKSIDQNSQQIRCR